MKYLAIFLLLFPTLAWAHGEHAWVQSYSNGTYNCCDENDTAFIETWRVSSLREGDKIVVDFRTVKNLTVEILRIYPTEDPKGRSVITRWGCLFRPFGM